MYPSKVSDREICRLIRELSKAGRVPSGAELRSQLSRRYGCRGGVARIYRLLAAESRELEKDAPSGIAARLLEQENRQLKEEVKTLLEREQTHQAFWTQKVDALSRRASALGSLLEQAASTGVVTEAMRRQWEAVDLDAARLEVLLRAFGPGSASR